jgi:hypothetical protein
MHRHVWNVRHGRPHRDPDRNPDELAPAWLWRGNKEENHARNQQVSHTHAFPQELALEMKTALKRTRFTPILLAAPRDCKKKKTAVQWMLQPIPSPLTAAFGRPMIPIA